MAHTGEKKRGRGGRIAWIAAAVIVALFALRFWQKSGRESYASIAAIQEEEGKPVETATAAAGDLESWTTLAGTVEGSLQYPVVSTNSITVVGVLKREGDRVKPGDVLIRLETTATNPMLYSYDRSLALYQDALADLERMRNLYREGAVSKQALEKAELALEVSKTDLGNAAGSTQLAATHAGVVTSVLIKEGEMAPAYSPLMWIARTDSVRVSFDAGSRQAMSLRRGQKAVWRSVSNGDAGTGVLSKIDLAADPKSHLVRGEAIFPNAAGKLIPGIHLSFDVLSAARRGVVTVPANCLVERAGEWSVFVVEETGDGGSIAVRRDVERGLATTDAVEIRSGVSAGDRVVLFGQSNLADGDRVKIVRGGEDAR
jgi:RND family efflux transporter MFP subunit